MKKKITIVFCIMIIIFNFIFGSVKPVQAASNTDGLDLNQISLGDDINSGATDILKKLKDGTASITEAEGERAGRTVNMLLYTGGEAQGTTMLIVARVVAAILGCANNIPQLAVEATDKNLDLDYFTIYDLVMGNYDFFNLNFFNQEDETEADGDLTLTAQVKHNIVKYYYIFYNFSIGISLFILIYIGIRMAISTVLDDRAKYKKMLINWATSLVLLFFMHFIIIGLSFLSTEALALIKRLATTLEISNMEVDIFQGRALLGVFTTYDSRVPDVFSNTTVAGYFLVYSFITLALFVYYQLKFFITYVERVCEIAFLIVIAPLVTITYSIDKVKDNRAQAYAAWFQEMTIKYSLQVVHALMYCIFIVSAGEIAKEVPILGALFLLMLDRTEKIFKKVFRLNDNLFQRAKVTFLGKRMKK